MAKKKKVNPYRIPATQGDIEKAKRDATNTAVASTWAIMFSVLQDKEGYDYDRLRRIWDETNYLADSIARKYVKIDDLIEELRENGIALAWKRKANALGAHTGGYLVQAKGLSYGRVII